MLRRPALNLPLPRLSAAPEPLSQTRNPARAYCPQETWWTRLRVTCTPSTGEEMLFTTEQVQLCVCYNEGDQLLKRLLCCLNINWSGSVCVCRGPDPCTRTKHRTTPHEIILNNGTTSFHFYKPENIWTEPKHSDCEQHESRQSWVKKLRLHTLCFVRKTVNLGRFLVHNLFTFTDETADQLINKTDWSIWIRSLQDCKWSFPSLTFLLATFWWITSRSFRKCQEIVKNVCYHFPQTTVTSPGVTVSDQQVKFTDNQFNVMYENLHMCEAETESVS